MKSKLPSSPVFQISLPYLSITAEDSSGAKPPKATTEDEAKLQKALAKIVQRSVD